MTSIDLHDRDDKAYLCTWTFQFSIVLYTTFASPALDP